MLIDLWAAVPHTMSGKERILSMVSGLLHIDRNRIDGDIVECGVWRGGNIILARKMLPDRTCWLYDTFAGMSQPSTEHDSEKATRRYEEHKASGQPWCQATVAEVTGFLNTAGLTDFANMRFVIGDVIETLKDAANVPERIALLRLDTDWYESTKAELDVLYPRLQSGGVLIVDDYGHWPGCKKAVDEYFGGAIRFQQVDYTAIAMVKQ